MKIDFFVIVFIFHGIRGYRSKTKKKEEEKETETEFFLNLKKMTNRLFYIYQVQTNVIFKFF